MEGRYGKTTVGIVTVIEEEFEKAKIALDASQRFSKTGYFHPADGPSSFVLKRLPDRGNVAAEEGAAKMIEHWRPDIIILLGIAGGIVDGKGPNLGDIVLPDYVHYGDFRKITEQGDQLRYAAYDQPTVSLRGEHVEGLIQEGSWTTRVSEPRPGSQRSKISRLLGLGRRETAPSPEAHVGAIVATEKILGDPDHPEQERIFVTFDHALAIDMESFGVARAVHAARYDPTYNPRLCIIRGISDLVRPRSGDAERRAGRLGAEVQINNEERARWKGYASATAAAFAAAFVEEVCA
jgi:nucleoside phosphorylase